MAWNYDRLWIMLIQKKMKKTELMRFAGINTNALARMGKNEPISMVALGKICQAFECNIEDIVQWIPEENNQKTE